MPKLNRIRVANVSYDNKYILDQIFDSYGGENMLLNLANGSGKSVLVQMMLQPILPCARIHDRKIESYLSKTSAPTYIMLEWKLDSRLKPAYFMTGIAMCSIGQGDETGTRVKYFTFTYRYDEAAEYDIAHSPLISKETGGYQYMPYEQAYALLKNVRDELHPLKCYARDKSDDYKKNLVEYGIHPEEWDLLRRINNKEGGVDELFADCKTSDAVFNKWLLRTVADKIGQGEKNLRDMFFTLMESVISKEQTIADKEILTGFLDEANKLIDRLQSLCQSLDDIAQVELLLGGLHAHLTARDSEIQAEKQGCSDQEEALKLTQKHIRHEELSEEWYIAEGRYEICKGILEERIAVLEGRRSLYEGAKRKREVMEAADLQERVSDSQSSIAALREQLEKLKEWTLEQETRDVLFSLDHCYAAEILRGRASIQRANTDIERLSLRLKSLQEEQVTRHNEQNGIAGQLGALDEKIAVFLETETRLQKERQITIRRTMENELDSEEVRATREKLAKQRGKLIAEREGLSRELQDKSARLESLRSGRDALMSQQLNASMQVEGKTKAIDAYLAAEKEFSELANRQGLSTSLDAVSQNCQALGERMIQRKSELTVLEERLLQRRDVLARLGTGNLHTSIEFAALLKAQGIPFITGEAYLKEHSESQQNEMLALNPMLPFCFLVGNDDFAKAVSLRADDGIDRICPVLILESISADLHAGERAALLTDGGWAMCYYFEDSFAVDRRALFQRKLEDSVTEMQTRRTMWLDDVEQLKLDESFLRSFPYCSGDKGVLTEELHQAELALQQFSDQLEREEQEAKGLEFSCEELRTRSDSTDRSTERANQHCERFEEYLAENSAYLQHLGEKQRLARAHATLESRYNAIMGDMDTCNRSIAEARDIKSKAKIDVDALEARRQKIIAPQSGSLLSWPLATLEARYDEIRSKQSRDERDIREKITAYMKDIADAEKELRKKYTHLFPDELATTRYDEDRLELLEREEKRREFDLREAEELKQDAEIKAAKAGTECDSCRKQLTREQWQDPLPPYEIKRDYVARRAAIAIGLEELEIKMDSLSSEREHCQQDINRVLRVIELPSGDALLPPEAGWDSVDIDSETARHKSKRNAITAEHDAVVSLGRDLKNYQGRHVAIDNVLSTLSLSECRFDYEDTYFVFERLSNQLKLIEETVRILQSELEQLESKKGNMIYHAFTHGKKLYTELRALTASAHVRLQPGKPRQPTLVVDIPAELDAFAEERIKVHVESFVANMRCAHKKNALTEKEVRTMIDAKLSDREILNQLIGLQTIAVRLLKVDISHANTKLRTWESIIKDNSGGELFISCFILFSALMDYSRKHFLPETVSDGGTKVMLIDNPFGAASSEHLVEALVQVAKQFSIQLICLSDLSQSSITAKFSLIYQLSVRPALYSGKAYLKTDGTIKNAILAEDSKLEHVSLRHEQMSLF